MHASHLRRSLALATLSATLALPSPAHAQSTNDAASASWMRYPALSPDGQTIVFTYKGDLYRVPAQGGTATPLTVHQAHDFMPVWSRDGKQIAFASDRYGNFDIFVIPASGGEARRVTFHSAAEYPYSFSVDGRDIVFGAARMDAASNRLYPTASQPELYSVPTAGGRPVQLLTSPAEDVRFSADGSTMLYHDRKGGENAWRKHQTSAIARDIWAYDMKAGTHRKITSFAGEDRSPVFADGDKAFYYLSESSGTFNVHRMALDGSGDRQLTQFKGIPVRFLTASSAGRLAFGVDGQIYTLTPGGGGAQPQRVAITINTDSKANNERIMAVTGAAREMVVSPTGKEVAFVFRGDVFVTSVDGGLTKRVTNTPEAETGVEFSPDGKALVYASERGGKWAIFEARRARAEEPYFYASTLVRESPLVSNDKQNYQPSYSPDGRELAWIEDRNTLRIMNVATKESRTLLTDKELFSTSPNHHFEWSPDGRWMLFDLSVPGIAPGEVGIVATDGKSKAINLTESGFNDGGAKWIQGGKAMLWFSNRDGLKSVAQAGGSQQDAYAMYFTQESWDRFRLTKEELALVKEAEEKAEKEKADRAKADSTKPKTPVKAEPVALDLERALARKSKLTIHSSILGDALVSKDGESLYYLARFERGMNLWSTNLRTKETKMIVTLNANSAGMAWDKEQKNIFLLADGTISKIDPATLKRDAVAINGEMMLDGDAERESMFDHVWRKTRDTFYSAGYHGVDWASVRPLYAKYLPHIGNNYEFSEMLSEMLGELNISHSGSSYAASTPTDDATASLGIIPDVTYSGKGLRIAEVIREGPLDKSKLAVRAGMIIEAIDGLPLAADHDPAQYLNRKAGKNVLLSIADGERKLDVSVKPVTLAEEGRLLYTRWVKRNQDEVEKLSGGALGYVHIPGMNDGAYRTTFEEVMGKYATKQGIVVDTRFNGGGDLVADLAMFLSGKKFFDYTTDTRSSGYEPNFRWTKPSVSLANEANYSDGHCFAFTYKELKLGTLVGMPTPGTCTFAGWETLSDGLRWGVPGLGVKDATTGKYLENMQTEPDVRVMNEYNVAAKGKDQQLEAAIKVLLQQMAIRP